MNLKTFNNNGDSCYIILHRDRSINKDRTRNLWAVIKHIRLESNMPILVLEQDTTSDSVLCKQLLDNDIQYQFLYNPGLFNRSWGYNCAINLTRSNKLILADNDLILNNKDLIIGLNYLDNYDIVKPFEKVHDLDVDTTISCIDKNQYITSAGKQRVFLLAGGLLMITRDAFLKAGGYDERFEGWGGEDDEMTLNLWKYINNQELSYHQYGETILHLHHERSLCDSWTQPNYNNNYSYINDNNRNYNITPGKLDKYLKRILVSFIAVHKYWGGSFLLYDDNTFKGGGGKPDGKWHIDLEDQLVLDWYHWDQEKLKLNEKGYCNDELLLTFLFLNNK